MSFSPPRNQAALFDSLFRAADRNNTGMVSGADGAGFLRRSGLPESTLCTVWAIADSNGSGFLTQHEFNVAMRLVAMAQSNLPVTRESLVMSRDAQLPAPRMDGGRPVEGGAPPQQINADQRTISAMTSHITSPVGEEVFGAFTGVSMTRANAGDDDFGDFTSHESQPSISTIVLEPYLSERITRDTTGGATLWLGGGTSRTTVVSQDKPSKPTPNSNALDLLDNMMDASLIGVAKKSKQGTSISSSQKEHQYSLQEATSNAKACAEIEASFDDWTPVVPPMANSVEATDKMAAIDALAVMDLAAEEEEWEDFADSTTQSELERTTSSSLETTATLNATPNCEDAATSNTAGFTTAADLSPVQNKSGVEPNDSDWNDFTENSEIFVQPKDSIQVAIPSNEDAGSYTQDEADEWGDFEVHNDDNEAIQSRTNFPNCSEEAVIIERACNEIVTETKEGNLDNATIAVELAPSVPPSIPCDTEDGEIDEWADFSEAKSISASEVNAELDINPNIQQDAENNEFIVEIGDPFSVLANTSSSSISSKTDTDEAKTKKSAEANPDSCSLQELYQILVSKSLLEEAEQVAKEIAIEDEICRLFEEKESAVVENRHEKVETVASQIYEREGKRANKLKILSWRKAAAASNCTDVLGMMLQRIINIDASAGEKFKHVIAGVGLSEQAAVDFGGALRRLREAHRIATLFLVLRQSHTGHKKLWSEALSVITLNTEALCNFIEDLTRSSDDSVLEILKTEEANNFVSAVFQMIALGRRIRRSAALAYYDSLPKDLGAEKVEELKRKLERIGFSPSIWSSTELSEENNYPPLAKETCSLCWQRLRRDTLTYGNAPACAPCANFFVNCLSGQLKPFPLGNYLS